MAPFAKIRKKKMPAKEWTACERGKCRAHRIACFHCKRVADFFCERHAADGVTKSIGGKRYCSSGPICENQAETSREWRRANGNQAAHEREYKKKCFLYARCEACGDGEIVGACAGRDMFLLCGRECLTREISTLCAKCCDWKCGSDGHPRCDACFPIYAPTVSCASCGIMTETRFACSACKKKACKTCDAPIEIDVSPMNIAGGARPVRSIKLSKTFCKECFDKTSVAAVQMRARTKQMKRGWY